MRISSTGAASPLSMPTPTTSPGRPVRPAAFSMLSRSSGELNAKAAGSAKNGWNIRSPRVGSSSAVGTRMLFPGATCRPW